MKTALDKAVLQITVRKDMKITKPFAETPTHYITMGFNPDLDEAAKSALREMISFLEIEKGLTHMDVYALCSIAGDLRVTQLVDGNKGIHMMMPKSILKNSFKGLSKKLSPFHFTLSIYRLHISKHWLILTRSIKEITYI